MIAESLSTAEQNVELGNELKEKQMFPEAIAAYQQAIAQKPDYTKPLYQLGEIYQTQENWAEAAQCYRRIVGINPRSHAGYIKLAKTLTKQNKIYGAIAAYTEAIEIKSDLSPFIYRDYGNLLLEVNKNNPDAVAAFQKAAELKSDWGAGFYNRYASLLEKQNNLQDATNYYLKALSIQGNNPRRYLNVGNIYLKQKLFKEAAGNYQRALEIDPEFSIAYKRFGDLLKQKQQLDDAIKCYQKALEIQPDFKNAYLALGNTLMEQGKRSEAQLCFQKAG